MLNQVIIVGRITKEIEIKTNKNGKTYANITLAVPRTYKNTEGEYETDFIPVTIWNNVAINTSEYCHKGDLIGAKGTIQSNDNEIYINADRITFLSSKKD